MKSLGSQSMQIVLERTGGFAGIPQTKVIDTKNTSEDFFQQLNSLIQEVDFFNLPVHIESPSPRPDRFYYSLTIEDKDKKHTVSFAEIAAPEQLKQLLDLLRGLN